MSLLLATLLPGLLLGALGAALLANTSAVRASLAALPRSRAATWVFFGGGAVWFLWRIAHLSSADFGDYKIPLFLGFAAVAVLSFRCVPDFLAVRGLAIVVLLAARDLLRAAFMEYAHPQRLFLVSLVYLAIIAALYLGAAPYRLRDFLSWLFARGGRARALGGVFLAYGLLLAVVAFTY